MLNNQTVRLYGQHSSCASRISLEPKAHCPKGFLFFTRDFLQRTTEQHLPVKKGESIFECKELDYLPENASKVSEC